MKRAALIGRTSRAPVGVWLVSGKITLTFERDGITAEKRYCNFPYSLIYYKKLSQEKRAIHCKEVLYVNRTDSK